MTSSTKRIFIALPVPEYIIDRLMDMYRMIPGTRWQIKENYHITLNFIGDLDETQIDALDQALDIIGAEPFDVKVNGFGTFDLGKNRGPKILWAGVDMSAPLVRLKQKTDNALKSIGIDVETTHYTPHITIARMNNAPLGKVGRFLQDHKGFEMQPYQVKQFIMYESVVTPDGSLYQPLKSYNL